LTIEIINQKENFDRLVKLGYEIIRLNSQLAPMDAGYNEPDFVYETEYKENQNYGVKGGSIHKSKDGKTGILLHIDFDVKEKIKLENGQIIIRVIEQAKNTLKGVREASQNRNCYFANTKTSGLHMGILTNEDIQQSVSLYHHQDCEKLRIDTRTKVGYVVAIAPNYQITKIPELFDTVISDFENFMLGLGFVNSDNNKTSSQSGSLSENYKRKARKVLDTMDISCFPELGTDKCSTHDFVSFCVMSCYSRNIPLEVTTEKIMGILSQITTTKDNNKTEKEIEILYNKNYSDFKPKNDSVKTEEKGKEIDIYKIAEQLMNEYRFITLEKTEEILFYKDGVYRENGKNVISKRSRKIIDNIKLNHINEIKGIIKDETGYISHDEFDKEPYLVNMKNIVFDLKTGKKMEHSPDYLSRVKIPTFYDPNALCPRFDKFLSTSLEHDEQKIRTTYEEMALCYIKDNSLVQKAFMNSGKGSNGKTILFGIIVALLGKENISAKTIHDFENNRFAAGALENKLANICADVGNKGINGTELLKKTISGDPLDCERKFMEGYTFTPYTTLIFSANDIPEVSDESDGFARRFELIEWEKSFYGKDRDHSVKTIRFDPTELSGIFNKVAKVAKELLETHELKYESTVQDAKTKWLMRSDSTKRFLDELTKNNPDYSCHAPHLFSEYNKFCKEHGMTPLNDRKFNAKLEKLGFIRTQKKIKGVNLKVWLGIDLINDMNKGNTKLPPHT